MPFLTDEEIEQYEKSPFINKFSVESFYDYEIEVDSETISRAREMDLKYDGDNFVGSYDAYEFDLYDTLEDALNHHHKRIDLVNFENLTDDELKIAKDFVKEKLNDEEYLKKYGFSKEQRSVSMSKLYSKYDAYNGQNCIARKVSLEESVDKQDDLEM